MSAANITPSTRESGVDTMSTLWHQQPTKARLFALGAATLVVGLAYRPNFQILFSIWWEDPNYSHGLLVIPIALYILWQRLSDPEPKSSAGAVPAPWWGWIFLILVLVARAIAYERSAQWTENATLLPAIAGLTWSFGSWPLLRRIWPAIAFLVFMLPLPSIVNDQLGLGLQGIAATGSTFLLQLSGLWVIRDGNVINIRTARGMEGLDVARACSGLRMLMTMAATITATIILIPLPTWKRIALLVSVVPIALVSNIIRIVVTGWCYYWIEGRRTLGQAHDISGWLMMLLAMILVALELGILAWLVPHDDEPTTDDRKLMLPMLTDKRQ
jgi:exosortase